MQQEFPFKEQSCETALLKRDETNASRHNYDCSTVTKRSPELVSPSVCRKQKNKCNKLHCIHADSARLKQKAKMHQKKSHELGTHKVGTNCKTRDRMKERRENIRREKRQKRDETNASRHNYDCSTVTKRSPELVSPSVCRKQKNKCNKLHCIHADSARLKQKAKMRQKKSRELGTHKVGTNCKTRDRMKERRENIRRERDKKGMKQMHLDIIMIVVL